MLGELLGGSGVTSVMAQDMVIPADGVALDAGAYYSDTGLDPQTFGLYVAPRPGVTLAEAEAELDALIARFIEEGPDPEQLERVRGQIRANLIYELDDQSGRARRIGEALTSGLTLEDVEAWPDLLQAVTAEDVQAAARAVFRAENSVTGWLMAPDTEPRELVQ